jgi:hypothetical protein
LRRWLYHGARAVRFYARHSAIFVFELNRLRGLRAAEQALDAAASLPFIQPAGTPELASTGVNRTPYSARNALATFEM